MLPDCRPSVRCPGRDGFGYAILHAPHKSCLIDFQLDDCIELQAFFLKHPVERYGLRTVRDSRRE